MTHQISAVDNHRLDPAELTVLRARLYEDRQFRRQQLREIAQGTNDIVEKTCTPDVAAHCEVRHQLTVAAQTALAETEAALARMEAGRYGGCSRCGRTISLQLLSAHPQARYCTRCQHFLGTQR
ncbi:TraR/DksA family transcriptional regulator [Kribbella antiqua]|uniref:TraR/DksA family transcriptional regulator n=1 Tax=Kribbella antiqua TaxID=2512217 RepID=A0A4R2II34_9ACTN|nr:TraR/DksA C4-type zinc finger protein [Kribbella antiqua]TCO42385.1 TraR/DksA family transcriptional regulator [Kribbella antiqua]